MVILTFYNNFRRRIGSLLEGAFTDAILLVERVEIPVHKCILAVQSEYFSDLFGPRNDCRQTADQTSAASSSQAIVVREERTHQEIVEISDVSPPVSDNVFEFKNTKVEVVRAVLEYMYRGEYDFDENVENHFLALELAHQLKLRDLQETLINNLVVEISEQNFFDFYNMNMRYKNVQLEESSSNFLKENGEEIAKSDNFSKLTSESLLSLLDEESFGAAEIDIFRAVERWAGVNKPNNKTVKDLVEKIRLATMSQEDLFDVVKRSKDLPSIDILEAIQSIVKKDAASTNFRQQQCITVPDLNVAQSSLGAKVFCGCVTGADLISGYHGTTFHKVGGKPDCIAVKLDKTYRLNALKLLLDSSKGRSYKYYVEVSVDEKEWLRVVDHTNYWCRYHQFLRFDPKPVRFIKITGTDVDRNKLSIKTMFTNKCLNIISFEAMHSNEECSLVQGIQVAFTNVVLESRGSTVTGGTSDRIECIDGKENLTFATVTEDSPLTIKLGQPHWLSSMRVRLFAWGNSYTIESSSDGESWEPVGVETKVEGGINWRTFEFSRRVVLYFRVTMKIIGLTSDIMLYHFESPASCLKLTALSTNKDSSPF